MKADEAMAPHGREAIADILQRIANGITEDRVSIGAIIGGLGARAHGLALLLFAAPNLTPGPSLPGFSTVLAVPLVIVAVQVMFGLERLWLPGFIANRSLSREFCRKFVAKLTPIVNRIDRLLHPRVDVLIGPIADRFSGLIALVLSALLLVPLPFYPLLPSFAVIVLALGLLARDGLMVAAALALTVASIVTLLAIIRFAGYLLGL
jgi:hypothetical protein